MFSFKPKAIFNQSQIVAQSISKLCNKVNSKSIAALLLSAQILTIFAITASLIQYKVLNNTNGIKTAEAANTIVSSSSVSTNSIVKAVQLPEGSGLVKKPTTTLTTSSSSLSDFKTKTGTSIKLKNIKVKNLDGSESNKIIAQNPTQQVELDADSGTSKNEAGVPLSLVTKLTAKDITEQNAKAKTDTINNPPIADKGYYLDEKGQKTELKDLGKDIANVTQKVDSTSKAIKTNNTSVFTKEIQTPTTPSNSLSTNTTIPPITIGLDPDNQIKADKNFKGAITDEKLMSKAGLAQKKKFLSTQPKTTYKLNAEAWRYCDTQELVNTFCSHYYNGTNQNQFVKMNSNEGNGPHMYSYFGWNSPFWGVNANYWSSKSVGKFWIDAGMYEASTWSDDGIQVFIDNQTVISNYVYQPGTWRSNKVYISQTGWHYIQVDYFQGTGDAQRGFDLNRKADDAPPGAYLRENNDTRIVGNNFNITADAWDNGNAPSGINRVDFYAYYNGSWKYAGQEVNDYRDNIFSTPFSIPGTTPSQDITMVAYAFDNAGKSASSNWVTKRYTRQIAEICNMPVNSWCGNYYNSSDGNFGGDAAGISRHGGWSYTDPNNNPSGLPTSQGYSIDHGWWSAVENIRGDNFQGRTHGNFYFPAGNYKFNSTSDDTATIWIADGFNWYGNYVNPRQVLVGNGTSNEVSLSGNKIVIVDYKEYGYQAGETIRWDRQPPVTDNGDPDGKVLTANWGIGGNQRCFGFNAQAWDTGSLQRGVKYVRFFALYNSSSQGTWWRDLGTDYNNGDDIYQSGTHCLPNDVGSGTSVELSIHVADNVDKYISNGSSGNRWTTYSEVARDTTVPSVALNSIKQIDVGNTVHAILSVDSFDPKPDDAPRSGIKNTKYLLREDNKSLLQSVGTPFGSPYYEVNCVRYCGSSSPVIDICSNSSLCNQKARIVYSLAIEVYDNENNIGKAFVINKIFYTPGSGYSNSNVIADALWQAMEDRGAKAGDIGATYRAGAILAFDFLIAEDFRSCFGQDVNIWEKVIGCVATVLNAIGITKLVGILAKLSKVKTLVNAGESIDKYRDTYKTIDTVVDLCRVASTPTWVDKLIGSLRAEAAGACDFILSLINTQNFAPNKVTHTILGEISPTGIAGGYHSVLSPIGRKVGTPTAARTLANGDTIYTSVVEVSDSAGNWIRKSAESTFYPDTWSAQKIVDNVNEAFGKVRHNPIPTVGNTTGWIGGNSYEAIVGNGIKIRMFLDSSGKIISAFPII